jgi:hypothetical protein
MKLGKIAPDLIFILSIFIVIFIVIAVFWFCLNVHEGFDDSPTAALAAASGIDPKKICISMLYTPNIASYSAITEEINREYANRWGYSMNVMKKRLANDRAPQWDKIQAVLQLMDDPAQYEYIFWIDSDAYFNDHTKRIDEIMDLTKNTDLHISTDLPYGVWTVNTGIFCVRNNDWIKKFFKRIWSSKEYLYEYYHEQSVMSILIDSNYDGAQNHTTIYPVEVINNNKPTDPCFICHMMGEKTDYRVFYANQRLQKLKQGILEAPGMRIRAGAGAGAGAGVGDGAVQGPGFPPQRGKNMAPSKGAKTASQDLSK